MADRDTVHHHVRIRGRACLSGGIHGAGKVAIVTFALPCLMLIILFFRVIFLDGVKEGLYYYVVPDFNRVLDVRCGSGLRSNRILVDRKYCWHRPGLVQQTQLSTHNRRRVDSLMWKQYIFHFRGMVVFGVIGNMAYQRRVAFEVMSHIIGQIDFEKTSGEATAQAGNLQEAFKEAPRARTRNDRRAQQRRPLRYRSRFSPRPSPISIPIFAVFFFSTIVFIGVDTGLAWLQTLVTNATDAIGRFKPAWVGLESGAMGEPNPTEDVSFKSPSDVMRYNEALSPDLGAAW